MIPQITRTNTDKLNIVLAGVDSGAKILVRPVQGSRSSQPQQPETEEEREYLKGVHHDRVSCPAHFRFASVWASDL
jgi:hypothetical protein